VKRLILVIFCIVVYVLSLQWQAKRLEFKNSAEHPSIFSERKKYGIPVYTAKVRQSDLSTYLTVTGFKAGATHLIVEVTPQTLTRLVVGQKAFVKSKNGVIKGKVIYISKNTTLLSGLSKVKIKFISQLPKSKYITANIAVKTFINQKIIPYESVSSREAKPFVLVVDEKNKIKKIKITVVAKNNDSYAVGKELKIGDEVVISDLRSLKNGDKVRRCND